MKLVGLVVLVACVCVCSGRAIRHRVAPIVQTRLLALEREILSVDDIPVPTLVRLLELNNTLGVTKAPAKKASKHHKKGHADLDLETGGAAVKETQYEKDMYQMLFLHSVAELQELPEKKSSLPHPIQSAMTKNKPRHQGELPTQIYWDLKNQYDKTFKKVFLDEKNECINCIKDKEALARFSAVWNRLPLLEPIGEGVDQYFDVAQKCLTDVALRAATKEVAENGIAIEEFAKELGKRFHQDELTESLPQIQNMLKSLTYNFAPGDAEQKTISVCHYARAYLRERMWFLAEEEANAAFTKLTSASKDPNPSIAYGDFVTTFKSAVRGDTVPAGTDHEYDLKALFRIADMSSYLDPQGAPTAPLAEITGKLDACEFEIAYSMIHGAHKWNMDNFWPATEGLKFEGLQSKVGEGQAMLYRDFERMLKIVDLGDFIESSTVPEATKPTESEQWYDLGQLVDLDATDDTDSHRLAYMVFKNIAAQTGATTDPSSSATTEVVADKNPTISKANLVKYLESLRCEEPKYRKLESDADEAMEDYDREGATTGSDADQKLNWREFKQAVTGYPVLVHGVTKTDITTAQGIVLGTPSDAPKHIQAMKQEQYVKFMGLLTKFGQVLDEQSKGELSPKYARLAGVQVPSTETKPLRLGDVAKVVFGGSA